MWIAGPSSADTCHMHAYPMHVLLFQESHGGATWVPDIQRGTAAWAPDRQRSEEHQIQEGTVQVACTVIVHICYNCCSHVSAHSAFDAYFIYFRTTSCSTRSRSSETRQICQIKQLPLIYIVKKTTFYSIAKWLECWSILNFQLVLQILYYCLFWFSCFYLWVVVAVIGSFVFLIPTCRKLFWWNKIAF